MINNKRKSLAPGFNLEMIPKVAGSFSADLATKTTPQFATLSMFKWVRNHGDFIHEICKITRASVGKLG